MQNETTEGTPLTGGPVDRSVRCGDVLARAIEILSSGPLPETHSAHGEWCPYCALALAKSQLDDERGTGLSFSECLEEIVLGFSERGSDTPLVEARCVVGKLTPPIYSGGNASRLDKGI